VASGTIVTHDFTCVPLSTCPATYTVTLTLVDDDGNQASCSQSVIAD
jgi:hypothetical protein